MPTPEEIHHALIKDVLVRLYDESLPRIMKCLDQLTDEQIWWRPNPSSNSIGNLVLHLSGNVNQWICTGLGGMFDDRKRQAEFDQTEIIGKELLRIRMLGIMGDAKEIIQNLRVEELLRVRPVQTFQETGISILIHVTEHFSYHTGQIAYITKLLTARSLDFYKGIALE